jgi:hypothetical protein
MTDVLFAAISGSAGAVGRIPFNPPSRMDRRVKVNPPYASLLPKAPANVGFWTHSRRRAPS